MKVLLLEKMRRLGNIGSIVDVNEGYARNYLLTRKKAARLTKENKEKLESERLQIEKADSEKKFLAIKHKEKISGETLTIIRQAGDDGKLYGSVTNKDIVSALSLKFLVTTSAENIVLKNKIKAIGLHDVIVELHAKVEASFKIVVARSQEESLLHLEKKESEYAKKETADNDKLQ